MKSALTLSPSNQLSQDSPAGVMIRVRPMATTSTRVTSSGSATALGRRTAWLRLLLNTAPCSIRILPWDMPSVYSVLAGKPHLLMGDRLEVPSGSAALIRRRDPHQVAVVLELHAAQLQAQGLAGQVVELVGGEGIGQASGGTIENAVSFAVHPADPGLEGQVQAQAVRRTQARAFADQHHH